MEKGKSLLLTVLVVVSLLQSYLLAYSSPNYEMVDQTEYIQTGLIGKQIEVKDIIYPEDIVLHFGNAKHTVLYPDLFPSSFYSLIFESVKNRIFDGLQVASNDFSLNWNEYRNKHEGVELRFGDGIPINVLQSNNVLQIKGAGLTQIQPINRMFILSENKDEVRVFFFSDEHSIVYEATTDINVKNVDNFVGFGEMQPTYHTNDGKLYLPDVPLNMVKFKLNYSQFTPEQLLKSLFVDPSITRNLPERDGSRTEIYSDGKRGLEVDKEQKWMIYSDPLTTPGENLNDTKTNLYTAMQFINEHGGWNRNYLISSISDIPGEEGQIFVFRQYIESYPDVPAEFTNFGYIKVVLQKGIVSNYERSLINLEPDRTEISRILLPGGSMLNKLIQRSSDIFNIEAVFPAYRPTITEKYVEFTPAWAAKLRDGTIKYLE